jgi:hypothetical protein
MKRACKEAPMTVVLRTPAAAAMRAGRTIAVDAMLFAARASAVLEGRAACFVCGAERRPTPLIAGFIFEHVSERCLLPVRTSSCTTDVWALALCRQQQRWS